MQGSSGNNGEINYCISGPLHDLVGRGWGCGYPCVHTGSHPDTEKNNLNIGLKSCCIYEELLQSG